MSYCRFSNADIYLFPVDDSGIVCCACVLMPKQPSLFTGGGKFPGILGRVIKPCEECGGHGCDQCMLHGDWHGANPAEAINHVADHLRAGHHVPAVVLDKLKAEAAEAAGGK